MPTALVIMGHPNEQSLSHALARAYATGLERAGVQVELLSLASLKFNPVSQASYSQQAPLEADLLKARAAIELAGHVGWFFPTWWASPPALVQGFIERVFTPGWAFQYHGNSELPEALLRGRSARVVTSMDSPSLWYRLWHRRALHASFVNATLRFCGFGAVKSTTLYRLRRMDLTERQHWLTRLEAQGAADGKKLVGARQTEQTKPPRLSAPGHT